MSGFIYNLSGEIPVAGAKEAKIAARRIERAGLKAWTVRVDPSQRAVRFEVAGYMPTKTTEDWEALIHAVAAQHASKGAKLEAERNGEIVELYIGPTRDARLRVERESLLAKIGDLNARVVAIDSELAQATTTH